MKKYILFIACFLFFLPAGAQRIAVKNNLAADALLIPNLGVEFRLGNKWTLELSGQYNPFVWSGSGKIDTKWNVEYAEEGRMFKHWMAQPEVRYWTCEAFNGLFIGAHFFGGEHDITGITYPSFSFGGEKALVPEVRYKGYFYGGGLNIGHQWILGNRWNLEASIGAGYVHMLSDQLNPKIDGAYVSDKKLSVSVIWITKASLSIVFLIN